MLVSEYARLVVSQSRASKKFFPVCQSHSWKILLMMVVLLLVLFCLFFFSFSLMFFCIWKLQEYFVRRSQSVPPISADLGMALTCVHSWFVQVALCLERFYRCFSEPRTLNNAEHSSWLSEPQPEIQDCQTASLSFSAPREKGAVAFSRGKYQWLPGMLTVYWGSGLGQTSRCVMSAAVASEKLLPLPVGVYPA